MLFLHIYEHNSLDDLQNNLIFLLFFYVLLWSAVCIVSVNVSHLADTFVVKETQSVTKESGVVPVMSSHWAGDVPPVCNKGKKMSSLPFQPSQCSSFYNPQPLIFSVLHLPPID